MEREIDHLKQLYPDALYIGLADGARDNRTFLNLHTALPVTDFWPASEYLATAAEAIFPAAAESTRKKPGLEEQCHRLKHFGAAGRILIELQDRAERKLSTANRLKLEKAIACFTHRQARMHYSELVEQNLPIGSGITEAACKTIANNAGANPE